MGVPANELPPEERPRGTSFLTSSKGRGFRALIHPAYQLLFAAFLINQTGFWISHISLQGQMVALSSNDPTMLGLLFFALFVPAFLLAPIAGVAADRLDRKRIMLICYAGVVVVMGILVAMTIGNHMTPLWQLGLGFALGTCFAFSGPASAAVGANAVPREDLPSAVSLQSAANNLTRVVGPALAAPIVVSQRYELAFVFFLIAALIAAVLTARMTIPAYEPASDEGGIFARLRLGFVHARERRPALAAIGVVACLSLFGVSHAVLLPVYAESVLGDADFFAWIVATTGAGATIGAVVAGYAGAATLRSAAVQMILYAIALAVFALTENLWLALGMQVAIGYFYFSIMTSLQTLVQQIVSETHRGRVMSLFQVAWAGLVPFGGLGMGALADGVGVVATLAAAALVCGLFAAVVVWRGEHWSRPA